MRRQRLVVCHGCAAVSQRAQVFARIEAEAGCISECADSASLIGGAMGLRAVLDHLEAVLMDDLHDRIHVAGLPVQVHRHDCLGSGCDRRLDSRGIDVEGADVRLYKDRLCADIHDCKRCRDIGVGGHDDLVSRANAKRLQGKHQCIEAVADADTIF